MEYVRLNTQENTKRIEKNCNKMLIGSAKLHGFLILILTFFSSFQVFYNEKKVSLVCFWFGFCSTLPGLF